MNQENRHETEIKLRVDAPEAAHSRLLALGFQIAKDRVLENNLIFDTDDQALRASKRLLRLREAGGEVTLTFKGPATAGKHKSREEREVRLENFAEMKVILERLGYRVSYQYEKHRTEYLQPGQLGVATVDETPAGNFMELEGDPEWIDRIAGLLGYLESDYITASYATLYSRTSS